MVTPNLLIFEASVVMVRGAERPDRALSTARLITRCALHLSDLRQVTYDPRRGTPAPPTRTSTFRLRGGPDR
jgi:hypothetical protein